MTARHVEVAVRVPRLAVDRPFTYRLPEGLDAATGSLVSVPFHGRRVQAWVLGETDEVPPRVAEIRAALSPFRFFGPALLETYRWVADRYLAPLATVIDRGIPPRVVSEEQRDAPAPAVPPVAPPNAARRLPRYDRGDSALRALEDGHGAFLLRPLPGEEAELAVEAVAACLRGGRDAIVLVPEAEPLPHTAAALLEAFGEAVCLFAGGEPRERYRTWLDVLAGRYRVVVGTRPAVFAPLARLGLVYVAREAHAGHRERRSPAYHVRDVAVARAALEGAVAVIAALCPSAEAAADARLQPVRASRAEEQAAAAVVESVRPGPEGRAPRLVELLKTARSAFLLVSRAGYGVARVCRSCGQPAACAECGGVLTQRRGEIRCEVCGAPGRCAVCGATDFGVVRGGAERVTEWARRVAGAPVLGVDEAPRPGAVSVGTATAVPDAGPLRLDVVGILDADRMRRRPGLAGREQALATWFEAAAWAGRRGEGRVLLETAEPGDPAVQALVRSDPWFFHRSESRRRTEGGFPPGYPVFRIVGGPQLEERLRALDPVTLLATGDDDERVCLLAIRPRSLPELRERVRAWARSGEVRRVDAEPHL